jgi:hypothetical protein
MIDRVMSSATKNEPVGSRSYPRELLKCWIAVAYLASFFSVFT